jgi:hypothetical protein
MKKIFIGVLIGFILTLTIGFYFHIKYPNEIVITKEGKTETKQKENPATLEKCLACLSSKGEITESIKNNKMKISYQDACKVAEKEITLKSYKHFSYFLTAQISNTFTSGNLINYGLDFNAGKFLFENFGVLCGANITKNSFAPHIGFFIIL